MDKELVAERSAGDKLRSQLGDAERARDEARVGREAAIKEQKMALALLSEAQSEREGIVKDREELSSACESLLSVLGISSGPSLVDRLARIPERTRELGEAETLRIVQRAFAILVSHYPTVDRDVVPQGWPAVYRDEELDAFVADTAEFGRRMMELAVVDLASEQT